MVVGVPDGGVGDGDVEDGAGIGPGGGACVGLFGLFCGSSAQHAVADSAARSNNRADSISEALRRG